MIRFFLTLCGLGLLSSCSGYRLGGEKPKHLAAVNSLYLPLAKTRTLFPRSEALTTNVVVDAITSNEPKFNCDDVLLRFERPPS